MFYVSKRTKTKKKLFATRNRTRIVESKNILWESTLTITPQETYYAKTHIPNWIELFSITDNWKNEWIVNMKYVLTNFCYVDVFPNIRWTRQCNKNFVCPSCLQFLHFFHVISFARCAVTVHFNLLFGFCRSMSAVV